ncbi:MAG TPA: hypothetical protein VJW20_21635 [Candidatus Angelobacter sp.]|nr:hypothetical protein [Candidatus Angelobacter sp.]
MESADQQWQELRESYEHMTEDELGAVAEQGYDLTEIARKVLQTVITERGFTVQLNLKPPASLQAEPTEDDEGLINFQWPDNADHAWRWMKVLTAARIPSFLGPDNVRHMEEFQGRFDGPVSLKIRGVDRERAYHAVERAYARARGDNGNEGKKSEEKKDNVCNIFPGTSLPPMESVDQQFRQQKENYEHMTEDQLRVLAWNAYDLTETAREALQAVITERGFTVQLRLEPPAVKQPEADLVIFGWAENAEEAGFTIKTLAAAGIPSFLNLEVRSGDLQRAQAIMRRAIDEEIKEADPEDKDYAILCPRCSSAKVVMVGRDTDLADPPPTAKFQWSCDACNYQWVDNGIAKEAASGQSWPGEEFPSDKESEAWDPRRMSKP